MFISILFQCAINAHTHILNMGLFLPNINWDINQTNTWKRTFDILQADRKLVVQEIISHSCKHHQNDSSQSVKPSAFLRSEAFYSVTVFKVKVNTLSHTCFS